MKLRNKRRKKAELGAFALNDIIFFLLLFFLLSSTLVTQNLIKIDVPKSETTNTVPKRKIIISLTANQGVYLNNKRVTLKELQQHFKSYSEQGTIDAIVIYADKNITVEDLVSVLDLANLYNLKTALATKL